MEGYQFAHVELYSAKAKKAPGPENQHEKRRNGQRAWSAQEIIDELERLKHASKHVIQGRPSPEIIPGDVDNFPALRAAQTAAASIKESFPYTKKDGTRAIRQRKLRADAQSIYASVVSLPVRTEDALANAELKEQSVKVLNDAIQHERTRIEGSGGRLMMGVIHWDEDFLHAHIIALDPVRGRVKHLHPGHAAKDKVVNENAGKGLTKKEINKLGNRAYCDAMRDWQNDFHSSVFQKAGLLRFGPRRGRLSRAEYKRAKESAMMRASDEKWRSEIESAMSTAADMKKSAEEEIERGRKMRATAAEKAEALEFGADAVLAEKIIYRPKKKDKSEGLAFGPSAPPSKRERNDIAARVRPAFDMVVSFAKRLASVQSQRQDLERREKTMADRERRLEEHGEALRQREDQGDLAEAQLGWRSRILAKTTRSLRDFVPRQLHFVIDALDRGEDPVSTQGPEKFPDAWSIPVKPDRKKVQEKLDGISNGALVRCFAATQDAYLLCEKTPELQRTFGTGIKMLAHEAAMRGVDIETGKHDPGKATSPERARLHIDTPPEPIRVKRRIRERQLVR